jgi:integrase
MATITKRGKTWQVQIFKKGIRLAKSFQAKGQAQAWATQTESEINAGTYHHGTNKTFSDAVDKYLAEITPTKRNAYNESYLLKIVKQADFADKPVSDITTEMLAKYRDEKLKTMKNNSVSRYLSMIQTVLEQSRREWGWIKENPAKELRKPSKSQGRDRIYTDEEISQILKGLGHNGPFSKVEKTTGDAFLFAIETGMRAGEIIGMEWDKIDLENRFVLLSMTKNGERRTVPLSSKAIEVLKSRQSESRPFDIKRHTMTEAFQRGRIRGGVKHGTFHDGRHSAITRLAKVLSPFELARMVGHKSLSMTLHYYNETAEEIAKKLK